MHSLLLAIGFLTAIPVRTQAPQPSDLGRAAGWFPLIGLALGIALAAIHGLLSRIFSPWLTAALTVAAWAAFTGGLHLDGLADCCDGLIAAASPERRREIMRDPRLGAFGGIGLSLFLILKVAALASLTGGAWTPLPLAASLGRWLILPVARQPVAAAPAPVGKRPSGLAADFALGLSTTTIVLAALLPAIFLGWGLLVEPRVLVAMLLAHLVAFGIAGLARARLGGVTGDVLGLTVEVSELVVLLAFAATA